MKIDYFKLMWAIAGGVLIGMLWWTTLQELAEAV